MRINIYRKISWFFWLVRYVAQLYIAASDKSDGSIVETEKTSLLKKVPEKLPTMIPKVASAEPVHYIFPYSSPSGTVQNLIHDAKFFGSVHAQWLCAKVLFSGLLHMSSTHSLGTVIIVPVPSSPKNVRSRGYDQCLAILSYVKEISAIAEVSFSPSIHICPILGKRRFATEQKKQNLQERLVKKDNPLYVRAVKAGNFSDKFLEIIHLLSNLPKGHMCTIFIVDDVATTGVTMENARQCVKDFLKENLSDLGSNEKLEKLITFHALAIAHEL